MNAKEQIKRLHELARALEAVGNLPFNGTSLAQSIQRVLKLLEMCPWLSQHDVVAAVAKPRKPRKKEPKHGKKEEATRNAAHAPLH